jgi:ketosteroid isomerase-like protein
MAHANIDLIQKLYAAFLQGDTSVIVSAVTNDVHWSVNGRVQDFPLLRTFREPREVEKFFALVNEHEQITAFSPQEFYAAGDQVFVLGHYAGTLRNTGRKVESDWVHVFTVSGGKIARFKEFSDTAQFAEGFRA